MIGSIAFITVVILFFINVMFHDAEDDQGVKGIFTVATLVLVLFTFITGFQIAENEYKVIETKTQLKPTMRIVCKDTICDTTYIYTRIEK
jgi:Na+/melibiose symporter-like transporter